MTGDRERVAEALAAHRVNYHHRNVGPEPVTVDRLRYTSCEGCDWLGGHRDEAGWEDHVAAAVLAALTHADTEQDATDPADGLSDAEKHAADWLRRSLFTGGTGGTRIYDERVTILLDAVDRLAARQRPTQQTSATHADTPGALGADERDDIRRAIAEGYHDHTADERVFATVEAILRARASATGETELRARIEALADEFAARKQQAGKWAAETTNSFREAMSRKVAWEQAEKDLRAVLTAAREADTQEPPC